MPTEDIEYTVSSGNVFADLELPEPEELLAKARLAHHILEALERRSPPAAFVSELAASISPASRGPTLEAVLGDLVRRREVLVATHAAPDVHLESTDLRVVAPLAGESGEEGAEEAAEAFWNQWLRAFLATHRCQ